MLEPAMARSKQKATNYSKRRYDVVAIGASAGGLNALMHVLRELPREFPSSIVIVQHLSPGHKSWIANLLGRAVQIGVEQAEPGKIMQPGTAYIAPPGEHLPVGPAKLQLAHTQLVHFSRPSLDLLFKALARTPSA